MNIWLLGFILLSFIVAVITVGILIYLSIRLENSFDDEVPFPLILLVSSIIIYWQILPIAAYIVLGITIGFILGAIADSMRVAIITSILTIVVCLIFFYPNPSPIPSAVLQAAYIVLGITIGFILGAIADSMRVAIITFILTIVICLIIFYLNPSPIPPAVLRAACYIVLGITIGFILGAITDSMEVALIAIILTIVICLIFFYLIPSPIPLPPTVLLYRIEDARMTLCDSYEFQCEASSFSEFSSNDDICAAWTEVNRDTNDSFAFFAYNEDEQQIFDYLETGTDSTITQHCRVEPIDNPGVSGVYQTEFTANGRPVERIDWSVTTPTCVYYQIDAPVILHDGMEIITSTIQITDQGMISDLNVDINMSHSWVGDLLISLYHVQTDSKVTIIDRPGHPPRPYGNCSGDNIVTTLDDMASVPVEDVCTNSLPTIQGIYNPSEPLSIFNGENKEGTWILWVEDVYVSADSGVLNNWGIEICTIGEE